MAKHQVNQKPTFSYPTVIVSRELLEKYWRQPWESVIGAAESGADGLRIGSGDDVHNDVPVDHAVLRCIDSPGRGKVTGLLYQRW